MCPFDTRQRAQGLASFAVGGVALVMIVLTMSNLALWLHAQNAAVAAAQEAVAQASREDAAPERASLVARAMLVASLGATAADTLSVTVQSDADSVTADVRGAWQMVLLGPRVTVPVHATARLARERFRPGGR
jgi:hypothetical protein